MELSYKDRFYRADSNSLVRMGFPLYGDPQSYAEELADEACKEEEISAPPLAWKLTDIHEMNQLLAHFDAEDRTSWRVVGMPGRYRKAGSRKLLLDSRISREIMVVPEEVYETYTEDRLWWTHADGPILCSESMVRRTKELLLDALEDVCCGTRSQCRLNPYQRALAILAAHEFGGLSASCFEEAVKIIEKEDLAVYVEAYLSISRRSLFRELPVETTRREDLAESLVLSLFAREGAVDVLSKHSHPRILALLLLRISCTSLSSLLLSVILERVSRKDGRLHCDTDICRITRDLALEMRSCSGYYPDYPIRSLLQMHMGSLWGSLHEYWRKLEKKSVEQVTEESMEKLLENRKRKSLRERLKLPQGYDNLKRMIFEKRHGEMMPLDRLDAAECLLLASSAISDQRGNRYLVPGLGAYTSKGEAVRSIQHYCEGSHVMLDAFYQIYRYDRMELSCFRQLIKSGMLHSLVTQDCTSYSRSRPWPIECEIYSMKEVSPRLLGWIITCIFDRDSIKSKEEVVKPRAYISRAQIEQLIMKTGSRFLED